MIDLSTARKQVQADLGYKPLSRLWAKAEIVLGLLAVAVSLSWMVQEEIWQKSGSLARMAVLLFVLGGYLTLAGHRSHLYQTINEHTAYLLEQLRRIKNEG
jgi:hypothetical protein